MAGMMPLLGGKRLAFADSGAPKDKAVVFTSFGVGDKEIRHRTLGAVVTDLRAKFKDADVLEAYTSDFLREKISEQEGSPALSLPAALEKLATGGYREVLVLPSHLTPGEEYENKVASVVREFSSRFARLVLAEPVFSALEDYASVLAALLMDLHVRPGEELVLMGHGSPHRHNPVYEQLQAHIDREGLPAHVGVLEASDTPSLDDVLARLARTGSKSVLLAPLLLTGGRHVEQEMAGDAPTSWKSRLEAAGYAVRVSPYGLGEYPAFRSLYLKKAEKALQEA